MKVAGYKEKNLVKEFRLIVMGLNTKVNGKTIKKMELGF